MRRGNDPMTLPDYVLECINALEGAGFAAYAVGGCVRDCCLGLIPHDYDLCTNAAPEQIKSVFAGRRLVLAGEKHGTVSVTAGKALVEITTFRAEGGYTDNRHPGWVSFVPTVEEDLARRDFTVNAMAYSPTRGFIDPYGGRQDLENHVLRAVGDPAARFQEDALRILRGVRFAVRFGLTPEAATMAAMESQAPRMDSIARERVFEELCKLLPLVRAEDLLRFSSVLARILPELAPTVGFDQHSPHHAYDLFTHIAHVTAAVPPELSLRFAALLHDVGKVPAFTLDENGRGHFYGHAGISARMAEDILLRLKAPAGLRERVVRLIELHMTRLEPDRKVIRRWLGRLGAETLDALLTLQEADMGAKGTGKQDKMSQFPLLREMIGEIMAEGSCLTLRDLAVNGSDLIAIGFAPGKRLGSCLNSLLLQVQDERLPNTKEALLLAAKGML